MTSRAILLASALLVVGCGARTNLEAPLADQIGSCGDGVVDPGEECDGDGPEQRRFVLTQGDLRRTVTPVTTTISAQTFYAYSSKSAHTGFEQLERSKLFLHLSSSTDELTLVSLHGIDIDATGIVQPFSRVSQRFTGLPPVAIVTMADDGEKEFFRDEEEADVAIGQWEFEVNTDGGAIGNLPTSDEWSIEIASEFIEGVGAWDFVDGDQTLIGLTLSEPATLALVFQGGPCRPDCTRGPE
jgi:hypothetical protein